MTSYPTEANESHWWLTTWKGWDRLHAVPREAVDPDDEDALEDLRIEGVVTTARCGMTTRMAWPGIFSRLGKPRCAYCCRALGIPTGNGTPGNEKHRLEREASARNCVVCGNGADVDDDRLCEDCAADGWGDDADPVRPTEDVPVQGGLL